MNLNILRAIFVRNFVSFYSSVTGYAFIFLFVLLNAVVNFGLDLLYNTNLANLDILTSVYPFTMLLFIPAITMGLWAGERRDGTDELLLTMPGSDLDIVLGKYLAAVAIYTTSLLFSLVPNYLLLNQLASTDGGLALKPAIDVGLFATTYVGYWLMGLPMLAVGMVASFLTRNLTLAWLLGNCFNAWLAGLIGLAALAAYFSGVFGDLLPGLLEISDNLTAPCRGTLSLMGAVLFLVIIVVMLYLCMVLIGHRHWVRRGGALMSLHYALRTLALVVIGISTVVLARQYEVRVDMTSERLTSLAKETKQLLADLESDRPVVIEAFVSPEVPEAYIQTKKNLENTVREMAALGRGKVQARVVQTEDLTEEAILAEDRYGITPREVIDSQGGKIKMERIFMGVTIRSGLNRVTLPFVDRGIPVEYELIRSVCTVLEEKRRKIGVLVTDAPLYGQFNMQTMSAGRNWPMIDELEKQYEVVRVDASQPIDHQQYDALLAVQPSTLGPQQMDNFVRAVRAGLPTAIFEDPAPLLAGVTGTGQPRRPPGGMNMMMMGQRSPPKGDIARLWDLLGVRFSPEVVVWQKHNPYPKVEQFDEQPEFVFVDSGGAGQYFNPDAPITSKLQQVLFPFPGSITELNVSPMEIEPLVKTGTQTGTVRFDDLIQRTPFGSSGGLNPHRRLVPTGNAYAMAVRIRGEVDAPAMDEASMVGEENKGKNEKPAKSKINVVLVADIDMLSPAFFFLRQQGGNPESPVHFEFDNVTFMLNVLDALAGDNRFIEIRKRRRIHRPLARIEQQTEQARSQMAKAVAHSDEEYEEAIRGEQQKLNKQVREIEKKMRAENLDLVEIARRVAIVKQAGDKRFTAKVERLERKRDREIRDEKTKEKKKISEIRLKYKQYAWFLTPIPPLLLGIFVFIRRRSREIKHAHQREEAIRSRQG